MRNAVTREMAWKALLEAIDVLPICDVDAIVDVLENLADDVKGNESFGVEENKPLRDVLETMQTLLLNGRRGG